MKILERTQDCPFDPKKAIMGARMPLVKCVHKVTGVKLDVIANEISGLAQILQYKRANEAYPEFKYLYLFFKFFLHQRNLNSTYNGGVGTQILS